MMLVQVEVQSPQALRALARFANDLADIEGTQPGQEVRVQLVDAPIVEPTVVEAAQAAETKTRRTKPKKDDPAPVLEEPTPAPTQAPAAEEPTPAPTQAPAAEEPAPQTSATTAETPAESGSSETATAVTHDTLRALYGDLVTKGKREAAAAVVKSAGYKSIKDIPNDELVAIHEAMVAL